MSYKYHNGSTPEHVDSSQSNPTMPNVGLPVGSDSTSKDPNSGLKKTFRQAQAKGDTVTVRRMQDRVSQDKMGTPSSTVMQQGSPKKK